MNFKNTALVALVTILVTAAFTMPAQAYFFDGAESIDLEALRINNLIEDANQEIGEVMHFAEIQISTIVRTYEQMELIAEQTEIRVYAILEELEEMIGPVDFKAYYITACNDWVGRCIKFDPVFISTSGG
jgi:2C-methyl-D-erythritol 2,4-cyclodiphosphate synthase